MWKKEDKNVYEPILQCLNAASKTALKSYKANAGKIISWSGHFKTKRLKIQKWLRLRLCPKTKQPATWKKQQTAKVKKKKDLLKDSNNKYNKIQNIKYTAGWRDSTENIMQKAVTVFQGLRRLNPPDKNIASL